MFYEWKMEELQRKFLQLKRKKGYRTAALKMEDQFTLQEDGTGQYGLILKKKMMMLMMNTR
jgi:hypothetical protein